MSAVMMLRFLELPEAAERFEKALLRIFAEGKVRTADLGGTSTCRQFTDAVITALER
jgi:isocitrate dehydrogenase (NAD+)